MLRAPWHALKRFLLGFWAVWLSLVVAGNVANGLLLLGLLPAAFRYHSGNYQAIVDVLAPFDLPGALAAILFAGVILWEILCAALYGWTALTFPREPQARSRRLAITFLVSLGLWAAFQVACEAFPSPLAYQFAGTHRLLFTETLATLLAIILLPDD